MRNHDKTQYIRGMCLLFALGSFGCGGSEEAKTYDERVYDEAPEPETSLAEGQTTAPDALFQGNLDLSNGSLHGQIGDVFVDHDVNFLDGYHEDELSIVMMQTGPHDSSFAMTLIEFVGGLDHPTFTPGERVQFDLQDLQDVESDEAFVQVIGCSGDDPNDWAFDDSAQQVTISVTEGSQENEVVIQYTARFVNLMGGSHLVTGMFESSLY